MWHQSEGRMTLVLRPYTYPSIRGYYRNCFEISTQIGRVKFAGLLKLTSAKKEKNLNLYTFGDGNPESFWSVAYTMFDMEDRNKILYLLMSKAKLGPIV